MTSALCERLKVERYIIWQGTLLVLILALSQPRSVLAQVQWTGSTATDISNPNMPHNVGIGIQSPNIAATLHVLAGTNPGFMLDAYGGPSNLRIRRANGTGTGALNDGDVLGNINFAGYGTTAFSGGSSKIIAFASGAWSDSSQGSFLTFHTTPTGLSASSAAERMRIDPLGNVGIGTNVTGYTLGPYILDVNSGFFHTTNNTTSLPASTSWGGLAVAWNRSNGNAEVNFYNVFGSATTAFQFSTKTGANTASDLVTIQGNGNVQVLGTITSASLSAGTGSVTGGAGTFSGNITTTASGPNAITAPNGTISAMNVVANYQDVAEWVPASAKMPAGTVVVIDAQVNNHVSPSSTPYDTRVAWVISSNPGVILGQPAEGKVMVATTGRVRVRVDATRPPIRVGDLLVTGDKEGVAMRSMPVDLGGTPIHRPGTLIGKALEPLAGGTGEILVLLSLQ
jgi:hypothetical protein